MTLASQSWAPSPDLQTVEDTASPVKLRAPYLIYFGDVEDVAHAKTGFGLIQWRRELCAGQMRSPGCRVDGGIREMCIEDAVASGVKSIIIGVAPAGGSISEKWIFDLAVAARAGLDIVSGMHAQLSSFPEIATAARQSGARLVDIRVPPRNIPVATGAKRPGKRLLTVGSDCAVGKKYTALSLEKEMRARGMNVDFRATGQTGIMIAGSGIAIDSVVADFLSGAAEMLSPPAPNNHWDVIEGQGSLFHPSFAGVSLGLLHGSQPDALVLCHDPSREALLGVGHGEKYALVPPRENIELCLALARRVNGDARFVGVSLNTSGLSEHERARFYDQCAEETGLPVTDPIRDGVSRIVDRIVAEQF